MDRLDADDGEDLVISAPHSTNLNDFEKRELGLFPFTKTSEDLIQNQCILRKLLQHLSGVIEVVDSVVGSLLRNTTNSTFLYVFCYASEGDFTMNGLIEVFVDV